MLLSYLGEIRFQVEQRSFLWLLYYLLAKTALFEWYHELAIADFKSFNELKKVYGKVSLVSDGRRVVFNIMGNKYRLVVRIVFEFKAIQIKWFGTHSEYDKIDMATVQYKK